MKDDIQQVIQSPERLSALERTALLDTPVEEAFDRVTRLVIKVLHVPTALVSLVDGRRQFFKSAIGLPERLASVRETPLSYSFCQHVVASGKPLLVDDARTHPLVSDNPAVREFGILAYAGYPLITRDGHTLGTLCVIETHPRRWTAEDVLLLGDLAAFVMNEIALREYATRSTATPAPQGAQQPRPAADDDVTQELVKRLTERIRQQHDVQVREGNLYCPRCRLTRRVEQLEPRDGPSWNRCTSCGHAWQ